MDEEVAACLVLERLGALPASVSQPVGPNVLNETDRFTSTSGASQLALIRTLIDVFSEYSHHFLVTIAEAYCSGVKFIIAAVFN